MTATRGAHQSSAATSAKPGTGGFSLIPNEKLIAIYSAMIKCRALAERTGKSIHLVPAKGREATLASFVADLLPEDALSLTRADAAAAYLKGMPLAEMRRIFSSSGGSNKRPLRLLKRIKAPSANVIPPAPSTAAQLHIACGVAYALKLRRPGAITVALCDDFASAPDAWPEALAFAAQQQLPILFVCQQPVQTDAEDHAAQSQFDVMAAHAHMHRVPALTVDGHDAVAVYRVAFESIGRARMGRGPTLIECRSHEATQAKRSKTAEGTDSLRKMEAYLLRKGLLNPGLKRRIVAAMRRELDAANAGARK